MTDDDIATFDTMEAAMTAALAAMPRRKNIRRRPYPTPSGYHSVRAGHKVWIVLAPSNLALMRDGSMYDFLHRVTVR